MNRFPYKEPEYWVSTPVLTETCSCGAYTQAYEHADLAKWRDQHKCLEKKK